MERTDLQITLRKYLKRKSNENCKIFNLCDEKVYNEIANILATILKENEPEKKTWNFSNNTLQTRLMLAWFCKDNHLFEKTANEMNDTSFKMSKGLYICGVKGSGKSSTVKALNELILYFSSTKAETRKFKYVEQNKLANCYELNSNINKYTYNEINEKFDGSPHNIILDDLKFEGLTKSFGTDFILIIIRFLYDRYSLWLFGSSNTIITSLLSPNQLSKHLPDDLYNRFKHQYNIINLKVTERNS